MNALTTLRRRITRTLKRGAKPRVQFDQSADYLDFYTADTDERVRRDPKDAVGGMWEKIGALQFEFLVERGLQPGHRMLDIGCGTLRGGRHFIKYLDAGCYTGIDISPKAIFYAHDLVGRERLADKRPRLLLNSEKRLRFSQLHGEQFDVLLAQSVFTHLKPEHITECFQHVGRLMGPGARFYFTFVEGPTFVQRTYKDFCQPAEFYRQLAAGNQFALEDLSGAYRHPRNQRMAAVTKRLVSGSSSAAGPGMV